MVRKCQKMSQDQWSYALAHHHLVIYDHTGPVLKLFLPCFHMFFVDLLIKYALHFFLFKSLPIVSYPTQVSDLDLAPNTDQFVASPPVKYINSGCCVNFFQKSAIPNNVFCKMAIFVRWKILVCASGHLTKVSWVVKI